MTLFLLGLQLVLFVTLSRPTARIFFGLYFALWRTAYDVGLGYVLKRQSEERWIVRTVKRNGWFDDKRHPKAAQWVKNELKKKMGKTYDFAVSPFRDVRWVREQAALTFLPSAVCSARVQCAFRGRAG